MLGVYQQQTYYRSTSSNYLQAASTLLLDTLITITQPYEKQDHEPKSNTTGGKKYICKVYFFYIMFYLWTLFGIGWWFLPFRPAHILGKVYKRAVLSKTKYIYMQQFLIFQTTYVHDYNFFFHKDYLISGPKSVHYAFKVYPCNQILPQ